MKETEQGACMTQPTTAELQVILKYLIENNNRLRDVGGRIANFRDRLCGERSGECSNDGETPVRSGLVGALRDKLDEYDRLIKLINEETCELEEVA